MCIWEYDTESKVLSVRRDFKGVLYDIEVYCKDASSLAFWLKHYMYVDIETFMSASKLSWDDWIDD